LIEVASGGYRPIVDHPNYSPRLIEYCTGRLFDTQGPDYVDRFVNTLNHPDRLWRVAFESHLTDEQRLLVVVLATMPPRMEVGIVQTAHVALCRQLAVVTTSASFRAALEVLEGTFISIGQIEGEPTVSFHNPSIREFTLDWLADDFELLRSILNSATYFEQMRQLYMYAAGSRRSGGHDGLHAALDARVDDFKNALIQTIESPCPEKREEWDHEEGSIYREKSSWLEERLDFLLGLDQLWAPDSKWIEGVLSTLEQRWRAKQGWKNEAVKVMQVIALAGSGKASIAIHPSVVEKLGQALDGWLVEDLEDTEEDWVPYLERLKRDHRVVLAHRTDLAARFEEHARDELRRWSPSPPSMDELKEYASQFGLDDLIQALDEKVEEDRQRDRETSKKVHDRPTPSSGSGASDVDDYGSDDAIGQLFGRFAQKSADPSPEGGALEG
jgi:hypothetical protein